MPWRRPSPSPPSRYPASSFVSFLVALLECLCLASTAYGVPCRVLPVSVRTASPQRYFRAKSPVTLTSRAAPQSEDCVRARPFRVPGLFASCVPLRGRCGARLARAVCGSRLRSARDPRDSFTLVCAIHPPIRGVRLGRNTSLRLPPPSRRRLAHPAVLAHSRSHPLRLTPCPLFAKCRRKRCRLHLLICAITAPCSHLARRCCVLWVLSVLFVLSAIHPERASATNPSGIPLCRRHQVA